MNLKNLNKLICLHVWPRCTLPDPDQMGVAYYQSSRSWRVMACYTTLGTFLGVVPKKIAFEGRVHCVGWKTPHVVQIIFINIWKASLEPLLSISIKMCNYPGNIYLWLGTIGWGPPGTNWHDCPSASFCHTVPHVQYSQLKDLWIFFLLSWEEPKT